MVMKPAYGTHIPVLFKLLQITDGPVLELGMGMFSTPILHWMCLSQKRLLVSYESELSWFGQFMKFEHEYHKLHLVEDWDFVKIERPWDIALVDHIAYRRAPDALRLADTTRYIVLHDTYHKEDRHYHYSEIFPKFKYRWDYQAFHPTYATIVSNLVDLSDFSL